MTKKFQLEVITPERLLVREQVDEVVAPGLEGDFGVKAGHCHFLSTLRIGELRYRRDDQWYHLSVSWGYARVEPEQVTVLAELAERAEEIDVGRAEAAVQAAQTQLAAAKKHEEIETARRSLEKAILRVRTGSKKR